jgi:putative hydrolase of the HAD superfamily
MPLHTCPDMTVEAVIFDWGGTLTPWHEVDLASQWYAYAEAYDPERAASLATELLAAEQHLYQRQRHTAGALGCGTLDAMFVDLGIDIHSARHLVALESYLEFWRPHTYAHPDAAELLAALRNLGLRVGVLSNTMWPREHHEAVFARDELLSLIDAAVYTSELPVGKPHESAFRAILDQLGVTPDRAVYVGDRLWEDVHGPQGLGMRAIWVPNSFIPESQRMATDVVPDATVSRLGDVASVVSVWLA